MDIRTYVRMYVCTPGYDGHVEPLAKEWFEEGIVVLTVTCAPEYATRHGVCKIAENVCSCSIQCLDTYTCPVL